MASEVARLSEADIVLDAAYPYVIVRGTATVARPRLVPVILGVYICRQHQASAAQRLSRVIAPSATPAKRFRE